MLNIQYLPTFYDKLTSEKFEVDCCASYLNIFVVIETGLTMLQAK